MSPSPDGPAWVFLDACCVINLAATGRLAEILDAFPARFAVADRVLAESLFVRGPDIDREPWRKERVDVASLVESGALTLATATRDEEWARFVELAAELDDGEAMTATLAISWRAAVATDDRKAIRLLGSREPPVAVLTTSQIVKPWADARPASPRDLRAVLLAIQERASFLPSSRDPLRRWWWEALDAEG
jgi:predicted nucleic acid-binding protein